MDNVGTLFDKDGTYKYKNIKLTPSVMGNILINIFDGEQFERQDAIDEIVNFHIENGGVSHLDSYVASFKSMTKKSPFKDYITNVGYGTYRIKYKHTDDEIKISSKKKDVFKVVADEEFGEGNEAVYVYYYDAYKELANLKGKQSWECKIGRTKRNAIDRVFSQSGTAYPERPHIAIIIKCKSGHDLEAALHNILKLRDKWISDACGTEWFITSPDEIKEIYNNIF